MHRRLRLFWFAVIVSCLHFVAGTTCLTNAVTTREDLVNAKGESYPVGLVSGSWGSSQVLVEIARIAIEEILGYNAQKPGYASSVEFLRALFGCTETSSASGDDTGCSDGSTRSHVNMESWHFQYQSTFDSLAAINPNFAPFPASNLFNSLVGIYVSKPVWEQKTGAPLLDTKEGLHENQQPWTYFDAISTFDASKLAPCSSTGLENTATMETYVRITGDTAGVDAEGVGVCHASHWWLAPGECRTSSGVNCVPWITGGNGNGWGLLESMQKAAMWQIPMAIAVASLWSEFTTLPGIKKCLFYWWEPDTIFAELEPKYVTFPAHDPAAWAGDDQSTAPANVMLENLVSYDLPDLAPDVYGFIHNFEMSMDTMRGIMRDVASGTSVEEAACEWTKQNEDVVRGFLGKANTTERTTITFTTTPPPTTITTTTTIVTCLENGKKTGRKDLVNANGELYPLGIQYGYWSSNTFLAEVVRVVVSEVLGYNARVTGHSTTPPLFRSIFGCTNPTDSSDDAGCSDGSTRSHVNMESWHFGFQSTFDSLVAANSNFAPLTASNLFNSLEGIYISKAVWERKTTTPLLDTKEGLHTDQQPWNYFDDLSAFEGAILPCSSTELGNTDTMENYVAITGDTDGVADGAGVCHANHWWLAPGECRSSSGVHCVPWITGGTGWHLAPSMQKAAMWQIPMAIAVAGSWSEFTRLPGVGKCLFYWWEPDTTFATLEPKYVIFPAHDATGWAAGNSTTAPANSMLENLVSYDLPDLAPDVYGFIRNFEMSMDTIRGIMHDVASGTSAYEAACEWTKQNEDVWRGWITTTTETMTMTSTITATETMTATVTTTASRTVSTSMTTTRTWTLQSEPTIPDEVDVTEPEGEVFQATLTSALQALQSEEEKVVIESATGTVTVVKLQVTEDQTEPVVFEFGEAEGEPSGMVVSLPPALIQQLQSQGDVMLTVSEIDQTVKEQLTAASDSGTATSNLLVNAPVIEISLVKVSQGEVGKAGVTSTPAPIVFKLQDADPGPNDVCVYFDEDTKAWSANGLTLLRDEQLAELFPGSGGTWCEASHLTIFSAAEQLPTTPTTTSGDEDEEDTSGASPFSHAESMLLATAMLLLAMFHEW